ncbi:hypothetical protein PALB_34180 [Pseudoalteromonas luteoviolacea B = ATCC 29581]|nr:hypothetical protein PALB_34180 [Pseudoalteromonas luteoviolacea B = ATCC 29581]
MKSRFPLNCLSVALSGLLITGCGDLESTVVEKTPITQPDQNTGKDHNHGDEIESKGRLIVLAADQSEAHVYSLDENSLLESFTLSSNSLRLTASAGARYALLADRNNDKVSFIDGGLWQEDHGDHLHPYKQAPSQLGFELTGSAPTHISHSGEKTVIFYDGNADTGTYAAVELVDDASIANNKVKARLDFDMNMHGVAKAHGEYVFVSLRRSDELSTSNAKILPDQIAVYHAHDDHFDEEGILALTCPDLHGAAQNTEYVSFGCRDGVLLAHIHDGHIDAKKTVNSSEIAGLRIGSLYGHDDANTFFGVARDRATGSVHLLAINPRENEMAKVDWQPIEGATPVAYEFSLDGGHFMLLDNRGYLTVLEPHTHDGHVHWEFKQRIDITNKDVNTLGEGEMFTMAKSKQDNHVYIADPLSKHVLTLDIQSGELLGDIELPFAPNSIAWLGIAHLED